MMRTSALVASILGLLWSPRLLALPEDPGPEKVQELSKLETVGGKTLYFDLYFPELKKPCPIVALGHGFARSRVMMRDWGKLLASRGYIAVAPDFPGADHPGNAKLLSALLEWLVTEGQSSASALAGRVDPGRRAVFGHSAGGLAGILAAANDPQIDLVVGLDPVDVGDQGKQAAAKLKTPVSVLRATPGQCNSNGNAAAIYAALAGPALTLEVTSAGHCDPEWPTDPLCTLLCGGSEDARRARFVRYAMATLDYVLLCDASMAPWLGGASAAADTLVQKIESKLFPPPQLGCPAAPDGSPAREGLRDLGRSDLPPLDAGADLAGDAANGADAGAPSSSDGCSCGVGAGGGGFPGLALLALAAALLRRRRR